MTASDLFMRCVKVKVLLRVCYDGSSTWTMKELARSSGSSILVNLVPVVYQRLSDLIQSRFLVVIFIFLVASQFLCGPPISRGERLIPAAVTEF